MTSTGNAQVRLPKVNSDTNDLINGLLGELEARRPRNYLRACYYDGRRAVRKFGSGVVPPEYFKIGIVLGWSAKSVDILARRCNLDGYTWSGGDLDSLGYQEVMDENFFSAESSSAIVSSLIHGPAFLINTTGDEYADEPASLIHVADAMNATGEMNGRTRRLDNLLSVLKRDEERNPLSLVLYLDGLTLTARRDKVSARWSVEWTPHPWGVPAEAAVYKPRVGRPFGASRISRVVMSLHDRALRVVIRMEGHADLFSYPELWMLGADPREVLADENGNPLPTWKAMMARIKGIPDDPDAASDALSRAEIQQFQQSSPAPHIDLFAQCANDFAGETDLPVTALGVQAKTNTTTADGSDNAEKQLIAEAEGATDDWSPAFRRCMARALAIKNDLDEIPPALASLATKWRPHGYLSRSAAADAGMKQLAAVPWLAETEVGLELLGLSDSQIARALAARPKTAVQQVDSVADDTGTGTGTGNSPS
ncbi:phage portal protein [Mycobacteroides abscessus]|uniref:phage portal protein n=1 Tax=Mycobacteroides abscessus TaxID=36809 RepID=UPI0009A7A90A|nr:phage portal protein [Mycobacteroides abscessus]MDB2211822.1 phage portal protein [Mycobacteroides abscessus subsp. massiliense]MDB2235328.1 phage portal protein [Mycobacteroides abscessus subsp. massiliense]WJJ56049.1 portal protein [Mycobacterium phage prophiT36-2b]SKO29189.1 Phage portal protein, SPP1 Gp6-like [Mycobacteroides abscessus subsp. massiliense]